MHLTTLSSSSSAEVTITGMSRRCGSSLQLLEHPVAVELGHEDVEQHQVERAAAAADRAPRAPCSAKTTVCPSCSSPRPSRSRFTRLSSAIRIVPARSGTAHEAGSDRRAARASCERPVLLLDPVDELARRRRGSPSLALLFDGPAELGERRGARGSRRSTSACAPLGGALRVPFARASARSVAISAGASARNDVDTSREELVAAEVSQVLERGGVEADRSRLCRIAVAIPERPDALQRRRRAPRRGSASPRSRSCRPRSTPRDPRAARSPSSRRCAGGAPPASARRSGAWRRGRRARASARPSGRRRTAAARAPPAPRGRSTRRRRGSRAARGGGARPSGSPRCPRRAGSAGTTSRCLPSVAARRPSVLAAPAGAARCSERVVELRRLERLRELGGEHARSTRACGSRPSEVRSTSGSSCSLRRRRISPRQREPVHLRHHHVEHGDVEPLARLDQRERLGGQLDRDRLHAPRPRVPGDDLAGSSRCRRR